MSLKNMLILCSTALYLDGEAEVEPQHECQENWRDPRANLRGVKYVKTQRGLSDSSAHPPCYSLIAQQLFTSILSINTDGRNDKTSTHTHHKWGAWLQSCSDGGGGGGVLDVGNLLEWISRGFNAGIRVAYYSCCCWVEAAFTDITTATLPTPSLLSLSHFCAVSLLILLSSPTHTFLYFLPPPPSFFKYIYFSTSSAKSFQQ